MFGFRWLQANGSFTYTETGTGSDPSPGGFPHGDSYMMSKVHTGPKQGQIPIPNWLQQPFQGEVSVYVNEPLPTLTVSLAPTSVFALNIMSSAHHRHTIQLER